MTLDGKIQQAIDRLRKYEPPEGYFLCFSGGKCSIVIDDLSVQANVKFTANYSQTGIDAPELVRFIKEKYPNVIWHKYLKTMWQGIEENGLPTRWRRWCCRYLKHHAGKGRVKVTGIHRSESIGRRNFEEVMKRGGGVTVNPIIDWNDDDVWQYIGKRGLAYCCLYGEGFSRLGCILCPLASKNVKAMEAKRYPKFLEAYRKANERYAKRTNKSKEAAASYFERWLSE